MIDNLYPDTVSSSFAFFLRVSIFCRILSLVASSPSSIFMSGDGEALLSLLELLEKFDYLDPVFFLIAILFCNYIFVFKSVSSVFLGAILRLGEPLLESILCLVGEVLPFPPG